jgi:RNA polymerase sigma-70 factor (TIGR02960 family)
VSVTTTAGTGGDGLLTAARAGDADAFRALVAPHLPALRVHCYRMLGSFHDAEEALQETLLRAWRGLGGYEGRAPLLHWLYRIGTTTCLKARQARARQPVTVEDLAYLEPYPDRLLDQLPADGGDPAAEAERRESVSLAFVTALQLLPATQSAVLILRDVLAWTSAEVADLLDTSVAAVNSALQRARATLSAATPQRPVRPLPEREREIVAGFVRAWHRRDIDGLAALLREDVIMRMPPESTDLYGRAAVVAFFATVPAEGRLETIRLVPTLANGQPALAAYEVDGEGRPAPYGVMVLATAGDAVAQITGFPGAEIVELVHPDPPLDQIADTGGVGRQRRRGVRGR